MRRYIVLCATATMVAGIDSAAHGADLAGSPAARADGSPARAVAALRDERDLTREATAARLVGMLISADGPADAHAGGRGNDAVDGGTGQFDGAAFFDEVGPVTASLVTGTATGDGSDTLTNVSQLHGGDFSDTFTGDAGDNGLFGNGGRDRLAGGDGDDYLSGGSGDDAIDGQAGDADAVTFWDATGPVTASLATGTSSGGGEGADSFTNVETLDGGPFADTPRGNDGDNGLFGVGGDDVLRGAGGIDFVDGGAGDDTMDGGGQLFDKAAFFDATGPATTPSMAARGSSTTSTSSTRPGR